SALAALLFTIQVNAQSPNQPIKLWPDAAPGSIGSEAVDVPTITPYLPPRDKATGAAVVVCPGGGYQMLADHEGRPVAEWLNSIGVAAFVLKYRIAPRYHHPSPMRDAQRALRTVRARAAEWGIDPRRIGILGFSAGGHLASTAATHFDAGKADATDPIERVSARPARLRTWHERSGAVELDGALRRLAAPARLRGAASVESRKQVSARSTDDQVS